MTDTKHIEALRELIAREEMKLAGGIHPDDADRQRARVAALQAAIAALEGHAGDNLVPGVMRCAKCDFRVQRMTLYTKSGTVGAGDNKTEPCPNGCGPLWPVTWEQEARECYKRMEEMITKPAPARAEAQGAVAWDGLPQPVAVKYPDSGFRDDSKALALWQAQGYDTGGQPLYSADQLHSYAFARAAMKMKGEG